MSVGVTTTLNQIRMGLLVLTRIPVGEIRGEVPGMGASAWCWPLIGAMVGAAAGAAYALGVWLGLPAHLAAILAILGTVLVTGGLHEDGLADLSDGFGGGREKARILDIMRDSRIGSYGAIAIGFSLLIRISALATLPPCVAVMALIGLAALSRAFMGAALALMPPARPDGLGHAASTVSRPDMLIALALGLAALLPLGLTHAVLVTALCATAAIALAAIALRKIGGQTGDVCGAIQQVAELTGWFVIATLYHPPA